MKFEAVVTRTAVRPGDLDSIGHVNNARVLEYLEHARWNWLEHHRLIGTGRIVPVVSRIEVNYLRELFRGDVIVHTALLEDADAVYKSIFEQSIKTNEDDTPHITAKVHVAFINTHDRRVCTVDEFIGERRAFK